MTIASVESLWKRAVDGDGQAFSVFYNEHAHTVFGHCLRRLGSRTDAEDITAEAFAITWRRRANISLDPDSDILAWLLTTANHLLQRHYRSSLRHRRFLERFARERTIEVMCHVDGVGQGDEVQASVMRVLDQLRPRDREIVELCLVNGLSTAAVAAVTGEPVGTVRARLSRALSRARSLYFRVSGPEEPTDQGQVYR